MLHDLLTRKDFIWHYLDIKYKKIPTKFRKSSDRDFILDVRPLLQVPSKNTLLWSVKNCKNAFLELSEQPIEYQKEDIWPQYAKSPLIKAGFSKFKISKKELNYFLRKEKITLESR